MTAAEDKVKRLAKLKSNTICPNCGTEKKFGFGSVCIKFHTFVCNECKSSHQAISHRCKSTTMSSWTDEEVAELERKGNDYCLRTWLKHAPPCGQNGRPQLGSDLAVYKRFVVDAYENKRFFGNDDGPVPVPAAIVAPVVAPQAAHAPPQYSFASPDFKRMKPVAAPASAPTPPLVDLLDFASPVSLTTAPAPSTTDLFGEFTTTSGQSEAPTIDVFAVPSSQAPAANDLFASQNQNSYMKPASVAPAPKSADFSGFAMPTAPAHTNFTGTAAPSTASDFEGLLAPTTSDTKKPIMRSGGQSGVISMMSAVPPPVPQSYGQMPPYQNTIMMQQQGGVMMNQHMSMMGGYNPQMGVNPQMQQQQQFTMQQQMAIAMQQNQMKVMSPQMNGLAMNQTGRGTFGQGLGGMNGVMHQFGGMSMNNGGMMVGGMNNGGMAHASFTVVPPQQQRQTMSDNAMPGGNVMDMLAYTQQKKKT